jgi:molecular chaperone DnaK
MKVAVLDAAGNPVVQPFADGSLHFASSIFFDPNGKMIFGEEARNLGLMDPSLYVYDWKRHMGTDKVLYSNGVEYRAKDIAKFLLQECSRNFEARFGELLAEVAISVPANYNDRQKEETKEAAKAAGLEVVCMPHEPTAALLGNQVHKRGDGLWLVIDVGGSTTDISLGEVSGNNVTVIATNGEPKLGGQDFNARIVEWAQKQFKAKHGFEINPKDHAVEYQEVIQRVEQAKVSLTARDNTNLVMSAKGCVLNLMLTRQDFESLTTDLLEKILACGKRTLKESGITPDKVIGILPVGGPSQMPMIAQAIEKTFGRKPTCHCEPHYATALGNVIAGRLEIEQQGRTVDVGGRKLPPLNLSKRDVTAHAIGVATSADDRRMTNSVILSKGAPIPSDQTRPFALAEPGQTGAYIEILQGTDGAPREECLLLGHFDLDNLPPVFDKPHRVEIRLKIDKNGMLMASAYDPLSGRSAELTVDYKQPKPQKASA